jgi:hypothetical protein
MTAEVNLNPYDGLPSKIRPAVRYILVAVDRTDQQIYTEVFYTRQAALRACDMLAPYTSIVATIIEDSHG